MNKPLFSFAFALSALVTGTQAQTSTPIRWVTIGNSITFGTGTTPGSVQGGVTSYTNSYPNRLALKLGSGYKLQNDGVNSMQVLKSGNHPYWTQGRLDSVFAFKPNIITICLGTNDSKPRNWRDSVNFVRDYTAFVDTLADISSHPKIWLCLPTPSFQAVPSPVNWNDTSTHDGNVIKNSIIPRIRQVAAAKGLHVIDLQTPLANRSNLFGDGVHPNNAGADTIASIIYRTYIATVGILPQTHAVQNPGTKSRLIPVLSPSLRGEEQLNSLDGKSIPTDGTPLPAGTYILKPAGSKTVPADKAPNNSNTGK